MAIIINPPAPCALINLTALHHNLTQVRQLAPASRIWAVVKADAYGHGFERIASTLAADVDGFAVARVAEAVQLRAGGITSPMLVLEGVADDREIAVAADHALTLAIHSPQQLAWLQQQLPLTTAVAPLGIWLKVDTGMHRLGFAPAQVAAVLAQVRQLMPAVQLHGLMTHLPNADDPADPMSERQCVELIALAAADQLPLCIGNSAGIMRCPSARTTWVRPGIMLYGGSPLLNHSAAELNLQPVMTLTSRVIARHDLPRGAVVGYGGTYCCPENMPVATIAIGYGDGYPRHAPPGTPVLINQQRVPLIGRVSMDMISVDLRTQPRVQIGDPVVLWGNGLPVEEVAAHVGSINYELLCRIAARVPRHYTTSAN